MDIVKFLKAGEYYPWYNVLFFPKILNELPPHIQAAMWQAVAETARQGKFTRDEYYLCASHGKTDARQRDLEAIARAININGEFEVETILDGADSPFQEGVKIWDANEDFAFTKNLGDLYDQLKPFGETVRFPVSNASNMRCQIIKLTRKRESGGGV